MDLAVDVRLAQAARDELRVLRAEIEDQDPEWECDAAAPWDHKEAEPRMRLRRANYSTR